MACRKSGPASRKKEWKCRIQRFNDLTMQRVMNNWNQLEQHLASWKPRQPSAALRRRLFPAPAVAEAQRVEPGIAEAHLWRLLAPGLALLLAMCMVSSRGTSTFTPFITASGYLIATVAVNLRQMAAYCEPYAYTEHNVWPRTTF